MSEFHYAFGSNEKEAILHIPNDIEIEPMEKLGIIAFALQKAIIEGQTKIHHRVWPCLYCGNRTFDSQTALIKHFSAHKDREKEIERWIKNLKPEKSGEQGG